MQIINVAPLPNSLSTDISPPVICKYFLEAARPNPCPLGLVVKNGEKIIDKCFGAMPWPWSFTYTLQNLPPRLELIRMVCPGPETSMAFLISSPNIGANRSGWILLGHQEESNSSRRERLFFRARGLSSPVFSNTIVLRSWMAVWLSCFGAKDCSTSDIWDRRSIFRRYSSISCSV